MLSYSEPVPRRDMVESLPVRMRRPRSGPGAESSVGRPSAYRTTNQATNTTRQFDRPLPQSDLGFLTMENINPTLSEFRKLIFEAMIRDDGYSTKSSIHDDDSDGSEYSVSSSLADAMAQVWNSNDSSQQYQVPRKQPDAVSDQSTQTKEHNVLPYSVIMGNLATIWRLSTSTPTIVLDKTQLRNYQFDERSTTGNVMNDGIGRVSLALMRKVQNALQLDYLPAAIQGRIGSAKGVWVLDIGTQPSEIWLETYESQTKWNCDWKDPEHRTLEVLSQSSGLETANLNHQFISILESRSVDRRNTRAAIVKHMKINLQTSLDRAKEAMKQPELFRKWIHETSYASYGGRNESWFVGGLPKSWAEQMSFLSDGGFEPLQLQYLHNLTIDHMESQWKNTKDKMRIEISQSTWALMVVDFQGVLGPDEVQLCFSGPFNDGFEQRYDLEGFDVIVARCPAHLPSDIQKVKAVFKPELRHLKDVVVFPFTGQEPLAGKLSGGDYDGDRAWICWDSDIVDNFRNAEVPQKPSFNGYFEANNHTVESLILKHGKSRYLDYLLEEAFTFHLAPKLVGLCTNYKERLAYDKNSIEDPSVINMSWLLSALVDQPKSGFTFNKKILQRFQKEYCENQVDLKQPAYKKGTIGRISEPCHIFDFLKYKMQEIIHQGLSDLCQYRSSQNGDGGTLDVPTFDKDLASYWNEFEAEAEAMNLIHQQDSVSNWLSDMRSNLKRDIDTCYSYWVKVMSGPNGKANYLAKVASVHEKWVSISPQIAKRSAVAEAVIWALTRPSTHSAQLGTWQLLKASLTFKLYHNTRKFLWCIAGRQLQFIKSSKARVLIPVTPRTYKVLRPDGKRIHQSCVNEDRMVAEDNW
ncbi:hypothetical protein BFJ72_g14958 [Fusarium proliferatum]|uniref:RNA-dependent RNA polymerase n=1 Tax=Gibberella intermedia TaxID=948311 RepID=A0A420RVA9_GIBIN|nr:hypothetical protein BFJ72_g14958 [Fusarium proliferatum]